MARVALVGALAALACESIARADPPPDDTPSNTSVPKGGAGAVVVKPKQGAAPAASDAKSTPPKPRGYVAPDYPAEA